jgi:acetyltransferase-like isoleucine patch superfamily enzyme
MQELKKLLLHLLCSPIYFNNHIIQFRYFVLPNFRMLIKGHIKFQGRFPLCNQLTRTTGIGEVIIGINCIFGYKPGGFHKHGIVEFQTRSKEAKIIIGNNVFTNNNVFICAANRIEIGDETLIGQYVSLMDFEAHGLHPKKRREIGEIGKITIGKNVWIGNNVTILKNSIIGNNTIIATGAVVSGEFPDNCIIGGLPAKIIKDYNIDWTLNINEPDE